VTRTRFAELWYCDPRSSLRRCRAIPCHGHRASADQLLVAKTMAYLEDVDWDTVYQSERRDRLRRAWIVLAKMRDPATVGDL
jgi:hypothetical protein